MLGFAAVCGATLIAQSARPLLDDRQFPLDVIRTRCIELAAVKIGNGPSDLRDCAVTEFGGLRAVDGQWYDYAIYCLIPISGSGGKCGDESFAARYHHSRALIIFVREISGKAASVLFERADPDVGLFDVRKPEIIITPAGAVLTLPIALDGTGNLNVSEYYVRVGGKWERIDAEAWLADLGGRIPPGLGIWKGVWPDFHTMTAEASLYRSGDGNCCPTGGTARVRLRLQSRRLVIESLVVGK